ncbi:MAG: O-antigen ligase family protein [bacterium]
MIELNYMEQAVNNLLKLSLFVLGTTAWFSRRHIFNLEDNLVNGRFVEWLNVALYYADILIIVIVILYLFKTLFEHNKVVWQNAIIWSAIILILYICYQNYNSDHNNIYSSTKIIFYIIFLFTLINVSRETKNRKAIIWGIIFGALLQSIIGILQFANQSSMNLWIIGEQALSTEIQNVAEIGIDGIYYLRSYGTLLHPNVLGGLLVVSIIYLLTCFMKDNVSRETNLKDNVSRETMWNKIMFHVKQNKSILILIYGILFSSLIFTFSRSAWLALLLTTAIYTFTVAINRKMFHVKHLIYVAVISFILLILLNNFVFTRLEQNINITENESVRVNDIQKFSDGFKNNVWFGTGFGNYIEKLSSNNPEMEWWKLQPIHNSYLLIIVEMGIIGSIIVFGLLISIFLITLIVSRETISNKNVSRETYTRNILNLLPLLALLVIMIFDHYPWSLDQGNILLFIVIALSITRNYKELDNKLNNM